MVALRAQPRTAMLWNHATQILAPTQNVCGPTGLNGLALPQNVARSQSDGRADVCPLLVPKYFQSIAMVNKQNLLQRSCGPVVSVSAKTANLVCGVLGLAVLAMAFAQDTGSSSASHGVEVHYAVT